MTQMHLTVYLCLLQLYLGNTCHFTQQNQKKKFFVSKDESVSDLQIFIQLSFPLYFHYE